MKAQPNHKSEERERWKRFKRDINADHAVLVAVLNARLKHDNESHAAQAYDRLLLQLMTIYVSPAALARYSQGFTEVELEEISQRNDMASGMVNAESQMLTSLESMSRSHPLERQGDLNRFVEHLYLRWQYVEMSDGASIEELSAGGVNVIRA